MPRNHDKIRCSVPGCRAWAMRGHTRCRAHRDREMGPRGAGAPPRNLNALKTGQNAHPLSQVDLRALARHIARRPDQLPYHVGLAAHSLQARAADPYRALLALHTALSDLLPLLAAEQFTVQVTAFLPQLPPSQRASFLDTLISATRWCAPTEALRICCALVDTVSADGQQDKENGSSGPHPETSMFESENHE
jgi:hypothetical protein